MKIQLSILNLLCLIAVVGVWTAVGLQRSRTAGLEAKLPKLRKISRELFISDAQLVHSVRPHPEWFGEEAWLIYVPDDAEKYELKVTAARMKLGTPIAEEDAKEAQRCLLSPGEHRIELREDYSDSKWRYLVYVDGELQLKEETASNWRDPSNSGSYSSSSSTDVRDCQIHQGDKRGVVNVQLIQRCYYSSNGGGSSQLSNGVLLWIDNLGSRSK